MMLRERLQALTANLRPRVTGGRNALWYASVLARRHPRAAGTLTAAAALALTAWVRLGLQAGGPAGAGASMNLPTAPMVLSPAFSPATSQNVTPAVSASPSPVIMPASPAAVALKEWLAAPKRDARRNLFAVRTGKFPADDTGGKRVRVIEAGEEEKSESAPKSGAASVDQTSDRQIQVSNLAADASRLRLQSTLMNAPPKALIGGELVREGDVVASFRVLKIEPRRVIVEREGIKLEITMN